MIDWANQSTKYAISLGEKKGKQKLGEKRVNLEKREKKIGIENPLRTLYNTYSVPGCVSSHPALTLFP